MKNKIALYLLIALVTMTAFVGISTRLVTSALRKEMTEAPKLHVDPEPVKVVYLRNPNIETVEPVTVSPMVAQTEPETEPEPVIEWSPDPNDAAMIAQVIYAEARGLSDTEKAAVAWCILNRVDAPGYGDTIREVVTAPYQFAFDWNVPILPELYYLAEDVLYRHHAEQIGEGGNVGRVLPAEYRYFWGDGKHNFFRTTNDEQVYFDWTLPSPYGEE